MSAVDDILNEDGSFSDEIEEERPKKKRRLESPPKKKQEESEEEDEEEVVGFGSVPMVTKEDFEKDKQRRQELKIILLKHPKLEMREVMELTDRIANMTPDEVIVTLESAKIEIGLKSPMANAISIVSMAGLLLGRYLKSPDLHHRLLNDTEMIVAVDNFLPAIGESITGPLQAAVRLMGHVTDCQFEQNNFGGLKSNVISTMQNVPPVENK